MNSGSMTPARFVWHPAQDGLISHGRLFQGIPTIECSVHGRIYAAWYGGMDGEKCGNYIIVEISDDNGMSWTDGWLVIHHDDPNVRCFDPCLWLDSVGKLWIFWAQSEFGQFDGRVGVWCAYTQTAEAEKPMFSPAQRIANGIMLNKPTVLSNGTWLMPCSLWSQSFAKISGPGHPELADEIGANVYASYDDGQSFARIGNVQIEGCVFDEHSIIELRDGRLWMLIRTVYGIGQAFSENKGKTWKQIGPSGHSGPNSRFHIRRLLNGDLLLINHVNPTNVINTAPWKRRDNLMAMISRDDGVSWVGGLMLDTRSDISYPDSFESADGHIYVIYDRERKNAREILLSVFRPEDVLAGYCISKDAIMRKVIHHSI